MSDQLVLLVAVLVLWVPGALLLVAGRAASPAALLGAAPLLSIGVFGLAALAGQVLGVDVDLPVLVLVALLAVVAVVQVLRHRPRLVRPSLPQLAGLGIAFLGVALAARSWLRGMGGLGTPPQEHDTITHTMLTAYIARTGRAGPGDLQPLDLLSGEPVRYYPAGLHQYAALLTHVASDPVTAFNAATVVVLAVAGPLAVFAAASRVEGTATTPAFAGLAALFAALLYRPAVELAHDAGILAFAAGLALLPALAVCVFAVRGPREPGPMVVLAVAGLGLLTVHPSAVVVAAGSALLVGGWLLSGPDGRTWLRSRAAAAGLAAALALVLALPWLLSGGALGAQVANYPFTPEPHPTGDLLGRVALFAYGPSFDVRYGLFDDQSWDLYHVSFAVLFWLGFAGCLAERRLRPLALLWLLWAGLYLVWAADGSDVPIVGQVADVFYNSANRLFDLAWVVAPAVAALGLGALGLRAARGLRARIPAARRLPASPVVAAAAVLAAVGYLLGAGWTYAATNQRAVADRYGDPLFLRITAPERAAFDYLASTREDVGRVLNNANDGSTYLYVYTGVPVVNVYPVGNVETLYGVYLLQNFNRIDDSPQVRCLVARWDITHVYVSGTAPSIANDAAPGGWTGPGRYSDAPGLRDLRDVDAVEEVFANDDARVYRIDPEVARTADLTDCPASPGETPES